MNRKETIGMAMILLILVIVAISLSSCGPAYHLRKAEYHIDKAIEKGGDVKKDTIRFHFKSPEIKFGTTIEPEWIDGAPVPIWRDTLAATDEKTGTKLKAKIDLKNDCPPDCIERVYLSVEVPPQDQSAEVPCKTVEAGHTTWELVIMAIACLAVGAVLGRLFWK